LRRNEYVIHLVFNEKIYSRVIIDQHYKISHPDMSDELIIEILKSLIFEDIRLDSEVGEYGYYKVDPAYLNSLPYRLIIVIPKDDKYIGVINAFRIKRKKK